MIWETIRPADSLFTESPPLLCDINFISWKHSLLFSMKYMSKIFVFNYEYVYVFLRIDSSKQNVQTQMKWHILWHFIWAFNVSRIAHFLGISDIFQVGPVGLLGPPVL